MPTTQRATGAVPPDVWKARPAIEVLRDMIAGEVPAPPITETLPFSLVEAEAGRVAFEGRPGASLLNPMGTVHGGFTMTLLDSAMTCAVLSVLAAGEGCTTVETKVNFVRPVMPSTGPVRAEAQIVHAGARLATAEGRLVDAAGRLYAHGSTTCLRFPL
jgi:uncharacterized protein (TIGR00369 family)